MKQFYATAPTDATYRIHLLIKLTKYQYLQTKKDEIRNDVCSYQQRQQVSMVKTCVRHFC